MISWTRIRIPILSGSLVNSLRPRQHGRHFADDIFKCIFLNEDVWIPIPIKISLKFVPKGPINNIAALVQIMAWRRPGDKPLSEPMMVSLPTHIWVARPQWVNYTFTSHFHIFNRNRPVSQMRAPLEASRETAESYDKSTRDAICFWT